MTSMHLRSIQTVAIWVRPTVAFNWFVIYIFFICFTSFFLNPFCLVYVKFCLFVCLFVCLLR